MIDQAEALEIVLAHSHSLGEEEVPLSSSIGRILAEDIRADRPFPPFDRVCMDGIAIPFQAYDEGRRAFTKAAMAAAGDPQKELKDQEQCIEIMTGAILPKGADTIVRYEDLKETADGFEITTEVKQGQNIHYRGEDTNQGDSILKHGLRVKAMDVNILASVGKSSVWVRKQPKVAVISSGEELVPIDQQPEAHQIRRSNVHMLVARLDELGIQAHEYHIRDKESDIRKWVVDILNSHDVLLLSGGVSKGKFDLIPQVLEELGVEKRFHFVKQRPGKPLWFGTMENKRVFAFPGNPVSTLACFHAYFVPWLYASLGLEYQAIKVKLSTDVQFRPDLTYFAQARIWQDEQAVTWAEVKHGGGSGDMISPSTMDGFVILPRGKEEYKAGEVYLFLPFHPLCQG
ncbi:MAG: molybdopterin molybdotransferase MoeA [Flavobacteriales bacterium]|nr:molybdopterin molybdotransferase MoeA [Flavobacteriales bacterium]